MRKRGKRQAPRRRAGRLLSGGLFLAALAAGCALMLGAALGGLRPPAEDARPASSVKASQARPGEAEGAGRETAEALSAAFPAAPQDFPPDDPAPQPAASAAGSEQLAPAEDAREGAAPTADGPASASGAGQPLPPAEGGTEDWRLVLVNPWNPLPEDFQVSLTQLKNGHRVDERCYPDLQAMMDECRAAGLSPVICSSYRTWEKQEQLFNSKADRLAAQGYSREDARAEAAKSVALPGTSEHQLGLALDIVDLGNQNLNESQEETAVQQWLMENSWKYGFILRYPNDKSALTGIVYEPWHYRYVGRDAAREIHDGGLCLEEYLAQEA